MPPLLNGYVSLPLIQLSPATIYSQQYCVSFTYIKIIYFSGIVTIVILTPATMVLHTQLLLCFDSKAKQKIQAWLKENCSRQPNV